MGQNMYPCPPHELLDIRPMKSRARLALHTHAQQAKYSWIPGSMDKIVILRRKQILVKIPITHDFLKKGITETLFLCFLKTYIDRV
jgi:hypothetical protein